MLSTEALHSAVLIGTKHSNCRQADAWTSLICSAFSSTIQKVCDWPKLVVVFFFCHMGFFFLHCRSCFFYFSLYCAGVFDQPSADGHPVLTPPLLCCLEADAPPGYKHSCSLPASSRSALYHPLYTTLSYYDITLRYHSWLRWQLSMPIQTMLGLCLQLQHLQPLVVCS